MIAKDFRELTYHIVKLSESEGMACNGRVVSVLEGGYDCKPQGSLPKCVLAHVKALAEKDATLDIKWKNHLIVKTAIETHTDTKRELKNNKKRARSRRKFSPAVSLSSPTRSPQSMSNSGIKRFKRARIDEM